MSNTHNIKTIVAFMFIAIFAININAQSKRNITNISPFKKVVVASGINIIFNKSDKREIIIEGERTVISKVICSVSNDSTLSIYTQKFTYKKSKKIDIYINYDLGIESIVSSSGNHIKCETALEGEKIELIARNGSDFFFAIQNSAVKIKAITGSRIQVVGEANNIDVYAENGSNVNTVSLHCPIVSITATQASHVDCFASERIDVWATYDSEITYKGNPPTTNISSTTGSRVLPK